MKNFTIIPNQILEQSQLSVSARYLYCVLLKFCGRDDSCYPSQITLGKILGYTNRYIRTLLAELIKVRLISKKRSGWNRSNTYHVVKLLDTDRIPTSDTNSKPLRNSNSYHLGYVDPIHNETVVPPINTYLKGKDKSSRKGLEKLRKDLVAKGIIPATSIAIKPADESQKELITNQFPN